MAWNGDKLAKLKRSSVLRLAPEFLRPDGSMMTRLEFLCGPGLLLPVWLR